MLDKKVQVRAKDRETVITYVSNRATSIGAARAANAKSAEMVLRGGERFWVVKDA